MGLMDGFLQQAKARKRRIVFPEGKDERILQSACEAQKQGLCHSILVGPNEEVLSLARKLNAPVEGVEIVDPASFGRFGDLVAAYMEKRKTVTRGTADRLVKRDLVFGGMMVATGLADGMVAGAANTTASVIQAAALTIGYQEGLATPSSFFIMAIPDGKTLFYADCAVNIDPTAEQLADIAIATARSYRKLMNAEPQVAFLSFSTKGSASHPFVEKVTQAVEIARAKAPDLSLDGEFQADTALSPDVAAKKLKTPGPVAGRANVLIFPELNAGNIAYKLTQYLAKAEAYGPVLQGFAKPVSDLSRGAKVKDILGVTALIALQA